MVNIPTTRLEAFSDAVIAIVITIMVIELKTPSGAEIVSLKPIIPHILSYIMSFVYLGIYWNNHHHLLHAGLHVNGKIMWANLFLLFFLSLIPFTTSWLGHNHGASAPTALYGVVLLLAALAYSILQHFVLGTHGKDSLLARIFGKDLKGKLSLAGYLIAIMLAFKAPYFSECIYILLALVWIVPEKRIHRFNVENK